MQTKPITSAKNCFAAMSVCILTLAICIQPTAAQVDGTWKSTIGSGNWSLNTNWVGDTVPGGAGSTIELSDSTTFSPFVTIDTTPRSVAVLNFSNWTWTLAASGGANLTFDNGASNAQVNVAVGSPNTTISSPVTLASNLTVTQNSANSLTFSGILTGTDTVTKNGSGVWTLSNANGATFSGNILLNQGTIRVATTNSAGLGTMTMAAGTTFSGSDSSAGLLYVGTNIIADGNITLGDSTLTRPLNLAGTLTLTGTRTITTLSDVSKAVTGITESAAGSTFIKDGPATFTIGQPSSYTGDTIINGGTLALSSGSALPNTTLTINNGATLNAGTVTTSPATIVLNDGTITGTRADSQLFASTYTLYNGVINTHIGGGASTLSKEGTGTVTINKINLYTGATTVNAGTLILAATSTINSTSGITINGGTFQYDSTTALNRTVNINGGTLAHNSDVNYTGTLNFTQGTLAGTNWNGNLGGLVIGSNRTISPGNSPGTANTTSQTWAENGSYLWEINDATGTVGSDPGWDLLAGTGTLTISATETNRFTIYVTSLTLGNVAGDAANFNANANYQWRIADFANAVSGFAADKFAINLVGFTNTTLPGSFFSVVLGDDPSVSGGDDTQIYLTYTIPEPSSVLLLGLGLAAVLLRRRNARS